MEGSEQHPTSSCSSSTASSSVHVVPVSSASFDEKAPSLPVAFSTPEEFKSSARRVIDDEVIDKYTNRRNPYIEIREMSWVEEKERNAVRAIIGKEIRDRCRPELDEFVDCTVGRIFSLQQCEPYNEAIKRCLRKHQSAKGVQRREAELIERREATGEGLLKRRQRSKYNRFVSDSDGWLPKPKQINEEEAMRQRFNT